MRETLTTNDGAMEIYVAPPTTNAQGAIVVIQEAFGVNDHIEDVCRRLASAGYLAVSPDLFHRAEVRTFAYDDLKSVMPVMMSLTREGIDDDLDATFAYLAEKGFAPTNTGIIGFCMGGSVALFTAGTRAIGAAVTYYGGGVGTGRFGFPSGVELGATLKTPWIGFYGDLDQGIPVDEVEQLREVVTRQTTPAQVVRYANAQHGFNCNDRHAVYDAEIAADAWQQSLAWFASHLH